MGIRKEMNNNFLSSEYKEWFDEIKARIAKAQVKVARAANSELIRFYWDLGRTIAGKIERSSWGDKVLEQLAKDLKKEFPGVKGLSRRNLYYIKKFYQFFSIKDSNDVIVPQPEAQLDFPQYLGYIPWGHIKIILDKLKNVQEADFYIDETVANGWSRDVLALQIKSNLCDRQGKALTNFKNTLPSPQSDLAQQTIKDPYTFDFFGTADIRIIIEGACSKAVKTVEFYCIYPIMNALRAQLNWFQYRLLISASDESKRKFYELWNTGKSDKKLTFSNLGNIISILKGHSAPALWLFRYRKLPDAGAFLLIIDFYIFSIFGMFPLQSLVSKGDQND